MNSNATAMLWKHSKNDEVTNPTTAKDALSETTTESNKDQGNLKDFLEILLSFFQQKKDHFRGFSLVTSQLITLVLYYL